MKTTLGGDRIGSGNKQEVSMRNYERSSHDLSYIWRSTMASGTLVPFMSQVALPGDSFDIDLDCDVKTHPTIGPLFGSFKLQLDVFVIPIRLYIRELHNNKLGIGMRMEHVFLPYLELTSVETPDGTPDIDNSQINPSALLSYLGIRGVGFNSSNSGPKTRQFNAIPFLGYWDIFKNYYANKQEDVAYFIHNEIVALVETLNDLQRGAGAASIPQAPASTGVTFTTGDSFIINHDSGTPPIPSQILVMNEDGAVYTLQQLTTSIFALSATAQEGIYNAVEFGNQVFVSWRYITPQDTVNSIPVVDAFPLNNIDEMRELILGAPVGVPLNINDLGMEPFTLPNQNSAGFFSRMYTQELLALKTYQSDLFNNWVNTEWIGGVNGIKQVTAIDVSGGELYMDSLLIARKVYDMLNRIAVSGGTYQDYIDVNYDLDTRWRPETPIYMGGLSQEIVFQEVVSNSASETEPLGTLAGKGKLANNRKGGHVNIKCDEYSFIMGIVSITPRIDYSQGNKWDTHLATVNDFHKPALDQIGFQELITEQQGWWSTFHNGTQWITQSAGKQPAYTNYMTNYNRTFGNFAIKTNEMFMTLNRRYEYNGTPTIEDLTTYIDPVKYNNIFAQTSLDAQNFWVQIGVNATARRKMSNKIMPNL